MRKITILVLMILIGTSGVTWAQKGHKSNASENFIPLGPANTQEADMLAYKAAKNSEKSGLKLIYIKNLKGDTVLNPDQITVKPREKTALKVSNYTKNNFELTIDG